MHVIATAGHVDHGKSTLVRALTGMEPDRWAEERARGLTIDLGFAWTTTVGGDDLAFVDVPGHRRFIGNMLAGLGPSPAVLFVVAADEGWKEQSGEHLAAVDALGLTHGLLVVTRADLADPAPAAAAAREHLAASSLREVPALPVSARTGAGLPELRAALDDLVAALPAPRTDGRVRLWVDRSFTITGAGTVVTGTLGAGTLRVGDELEVRGRRVRVRGLQTLDRPRDEVAATARVAVNLRGVGAAVGAGDVERGDALLTPTAWRPTSTIDAKLTLPGGGAVEDLPAHLVLHVGAAAVSARLRPLSGEAMRLTLARPLPLAAGDRAILRDPGDHTGLRVGGVLVVDADPPDLRRRGDGARRGAAVAAAGAAGPDVATEVARRGVLSVADAGRLGIPPALLLSPEVLPPEVTRRGDLLVATATWVGAGAAVASALAAQERRDPLDPSLPLGAAARAAGLADGPLARLVGDVARDAGLEVDGGRVRRPGAAPRLPERAEAGLRRIEARLADDPFAAPERPELEAAGLGTREIAAAVRAGRLLRLGDDVLLLPTGPARAMRVLAALPQPFTTSGARQALGTTRRVAIPLLEHLDARGWTRRLDAGHREVVR